MKLIVGLGNPGAEYSKTRHNIGFWVVDALVKELGLELTQKKFYGTWAQSSRAGNKLGFLEPQTYMNLSGKSVSAALKFWKIGAPELLVIHDELDLALGTLKFVNGRGSGGHNGVSSIMESLGGSKEFWRLRVGIGRPSTHVDPADHVLQPFNKEEMPQVHSSVERAVQAVWAFCDEGPAVAMQRFHGKEAL